MFSDVHKSEAGQKMALRFSDTAPNNELNGSPVGLGPTFASQPAVMIFAVSWVECKSKNHASRLGRKSSFSSNALCEMALSGLVFGV
jgi:hypothetical protein